MIALADLLEQSGQPSLTERQAEYVRLIQLSGRNLSVLVDDLLDLQLMNLGHIQLRPVHVQARTFIAEAAESLRPILEKRSQTLAVKLPRAGVTLHVDRERLMQVMFNLGTNASKYSTPGSQVELEARRRGNRLHVAVRDHGAGMSVDDRKRAVTPFFRVEAQKQTGVRGAGLGLAIARSLIELHGSEINIDSVPGQGTVVSFALPISSGEGETLRADAGTAAGEAA